jgi:ribosome assembly protein YihI (activator of Der GTPase)
MEALLEKEGTVESWNDERMDELSRRMDAGFSEMREGFARVDTKIDRLDSRVDKLFYIQLAFLGSLVIGLLTDKV